MVIANLTSGQTRTFNIQAPSDRLELHRCLEASVVSGLAIHTDGVPVALPRPKRFRSTTFGFELVTDKDGADVAERIFCQADHVRLSLTRTFASRMVRADLAVTGRMRFDGHGRR